MRPNEVARWVEQAREQGATRIVVRRARKSGNADAAVFFEDNVEGFDSESAVTRMRDDALVSRRLQSATFELTAHDKQREVMRERVFIRRDDEEVDIGEDPNAKVATVALREMQAMARAVIDSNASVRATVETSNGLVEKLQGVIVAMTEQHTKTLETMFDMAQLRQAEAASIRASEEKREMGKHLISEGMPVLGALATKLGKASGPALVAFLQKLGSDEARFQKFLAMLTPDERVALGAVWEEVARERGEDKKTDPKKSNHKEA